jgi:N-methylhydantoinase A
MDKARLAVDIGGTFTDLCLDWNGKLTSVKVLTTPRAPEEGVLGGMEEILKQTKIKPADLGLVIHGTTLATNAIIERKGAKTALVVTEGFRDSIEIAFEHRFEQYDIFMRKPPPLVARDLRFGIPERMDGRGNVLIPLDEAAVRTLAPRLKAAGIEAIAIGYMHAYLDGKHERRTRDILTELLPGVSISLSSEVSPEIREYERWSTAVANAYVQPVMDRYLGRLDDGLRRQGFTCPLFMITSGGGLAALETARKFPIRLVESGPAGGAILAAALARQCGLDKVLSFDMGGTTAKICLIDHGEPQHSRTFEVARQYRFLKGSGLPLRIPVIEMVEIGAGGGSLARLDALKRVTVGPESASAVPGPVCYNGGGSDPAVTDADVALGLIDPATFAGGTIKLYPDLAKKALKKTIGDPLGLDEDMAAYAVYEMVCENMASAARVHTVERGAVASNHTVIAFGGAAPLHVARVAEKIGAGRVIVPPNAGVGSAVGFLAAPISYEMVKTKYMRLESFDAAAATELLRGMSREIRAWVEPAAGGEPVVERRVAFMRYVGQGHEIAVELPVRDLLATDTAALRARYEDDYEKLFRRSIPAAAIEVMAWSVNVSTVTQLPEQVADVVQHSLSMAGENIRIFDGRAGKTIDVSRYRRDKLPVGGRLSGPAIIAEEETSTFVTENFDAWIDGLGSIVMERKGITA